MRSNIIDITVLMVHATDAAVLVKGGQAKEDVWLPKSKIEIEPGDFADMYIVTLPEWLALDKGLI